MTGPQRPSRSSTASSRWRLAEPVRIPAQAEQQHDRRQSALH